MENKIIDSSDPGIVVQETSVILSDEKLRTLLSRAYEEAQNNANATKFYNFYGTFLSVAGTLFVALLTSTFKPIYGISVETMTTLATGGCIISAVTGFVCLGIAVNKKTKSDIEGRDKTVEKILTESLLKQIIETDR